VKLGLAIFPTDESVSPAWLARRAEELGFESVFFTEHTHIPASRETPWPAGGELPREYARILDPFVATTQAATVTERVRVGTGICLICQHEPIALAKSVASVDHVSGGRFEFGIGAGWNREEMRNHGVDPRTRFALMGERVAALKAIWGSEEASFAGRDASFERIWSWPKPVQRPHPPVLVGGNGPTAEDRVLAYGDGWMPNAGGDDDALLGRIAELRRRAADAGREIGVTLSAAPSRPERLARYAEAGVERCVFYVPSAGEDAVESKIERVLDSAAEVGVGPERP
jgi:probable F420-dependent oxidoreductase